MSASARSRARSTGARRLGPPRHLCRCHNLAPIHPHRHHGPAALGDRYDEIFAAYKADALELRGDMQGAASVIDEVKTLIAKDTIRAISRPLKRSRIIAMEGAQKNVRSNVIAPFAWTRMIATIPVKDEASAARVKRMQARWQVLALARNLAVAREEHGDLGARDPACGKDAQAG